MGMIVEASVGGLMSGCFLDAAGVRCSVQESSLAEEACLWLGTDHYGRMLLTRSMAAALLPLLAGFAEGRVGPGDAAGQGGVGPFEDRHGQGCVAEPVGGGAHPLLRLGVERDVDGDRGAPMMLDRAMAGALLGPLALFAATGRLLPVARRSLN